MANLRPLLVYPDGYVAATDDQDIGTRYLLIRIPAMRDPATGQFTHDVFVKLPVVMRVPHTMGEQEALALWHQSETAGIPAPEIVFLAGEPPAST